MIGYLSYKQLPKMKEETEELEHGLQRVDAIMQAWGFTNHDLVLAAAPEQLTHKQVQRARSGRRLTLSMMQKVTRILNAAIVERLEDDEMERFVPYMHRDLFSYAKGFAADWADPNCSLYPR